MPHPLVLALFPTPAAAAVGARTLHEAGVTHDQISVISRNHDEDSLLARQMDATPGVDIEDSRPAARLGELSGYVLAAIALVMPGIGPIVAAGPLAAGLGEAAGHVAGGLSSALSGAGVDEGRAESLQRAVEGGSVLLAVHTVPEECARILATLERCGATEVETANWTG
jgi:uncharacterized membrane protein